MQFNEEATVILSGESEAKAGGPGVPPLPPKSDLPFLPAPLGSIDSSIRCWDCRSRRPEPVQTLDEARDGVSSVKVSDHEVLAG